MHSADNTTHEEKRFETKAECVAAAEEYIERYPEIEWRDPSDNRSITYPVLRSYIQCIPNPDG